MSRSAQVAEAPLVGVDLLHVGELDGLVRRAWFRRLVYAESERRTAATLGPSRRREFLAGRFAAKEAVLKVLGVGLLAGVPAWQVDIRRAADGAPRVKLTGAAAERAAELGLDRIALSIAHKSDLVIAFAVGWPAGTVPHEGAGAPLDGARLLDEALAASTTAFGDPTTRRGPGDD